MEGDLDFVLNWLRCKGRRAAHVINRGISRGEIERLIGSGRILSFPAELFRLYGWRNGTRVEAGDQLDGLHFFPGYYFLSFEDALASYLLFENDSRWDCSWFPIFANGGGDYYALDIRTGKVIGFLLGESDQLPEFDSITAMIRTLAECYEKGIFFLDSSGYLEVNDQRQIEIARKLNPGIEGYFS